jgi:predicted amidophosphoribosyltransferase
MKDSAKLLNFNVNRELKFSVFRPVDFNTKRDLSFNINRDLSFNSSRDLGFGKRGVVFRGYVCPKCRAPVAKNAPQCDECGVKFEQPVKQQLQKARQNDWDRNKSTQEADAVSKEPANPVPQSPSRIHNRDDASQVQTPERRSTFECPSCSKILYVGIDRCPACATQFASSAAIPPPPKRNPDIQAMVFCANCNYSIPPNDRFCRRCGSPRPKGSGNTMATWNEYTEKGRDDGIVSWDEYSKRGG